MKNETTTVIMWDGDVDSLTELNLALASFKTPQLTPVPDSGSEDVFVVVADCKLSQAQAQNAFDKIMEEQKQ